VDVGLNLQPSAVGADGDRPVFVGAKDARPYRTVALDHPRVEVTEPAVPLHGEDRDAGTHGPHEGLAAGGEAAMMGWFH
jgi:hypothetical protein